MKRTIVAGALLALAIAAPAQAATPGSLTAKTGPTLAVHNGTATLRLTYRCTRYLAPYDGSDILVVVTGTMSAAVPATCDGTDRKLTIALTGTPATTLGIGHEGLTADGTLGYVSSDGSLSLPIKVVPA
jgi:hypothetical protein